MAERCCVTGAAGFVGSHLVARLKREGYWVRAVDANLNHLRQPLYEQADEVLLADLRSQPTTQGALANVDWVFHLGADHGGAGYFYSDADWKAARNNLRIDLNVLGELRPGQRVFFASSACTYPTDIQGDKARPLRESDWGGGNAEQQYGEAKRMSTLLFEGAREHGIDARCGIFHTIYGPWQEYEEPRAKFPAAICRKVLEAPTAGIPTDPNGLRLTDAIEVWGDGSQIRTFLYIDDALERILRVMNLPYEGPVNIGSDEEVTVKQCADWVCEAAGVEPNYDFMPDKPVGVAARSSDNSLFHQRYGKAQQTPAKVGFTRLYEWLSEELSLAQAA